MELKELIQRYQAATFTVNRRLNALIKEKLDMDLTLDQFSILKYIIDTKKVTSTELSDIFCVGKSAITAIIQRLVDKEYILRNRDEDDRRIIYLLPTEKGIDVTASVTDKIYELIATYLIHFDEDEITGFIKTYERFAATILNEEGK